MTVYNFSAGPAMLPAAVMQRAHEEFLDWRELGVSVMEISHRSKPFIAVAEQAEADLRELLSIPDNYQVLFLQGGARGQYAGLPLNLLADADSMAYVKTGIWSQLAITEAKRFGEVNVVADAESTGFTTIPDPAEWGDFSQAAYLHYVDNETVHGVEFDYVPQSGEVPLIADMSSNILSRPVDVKQFGVIYAGAQKNIGMSGITVVIVRDDLLKRQANPLTPSVLNYAEQAKKQSMLNTPPTYAWYMAGLVFQWLKSQGGVQGIARQNQAKADLLYQTIDNDSFYVNNIEPRYRSTMNVIFTLAGSALESEFLREAEQAGLMGLKGHRSLGGVRASIYNAMPLAGVQALVDFMQDFAKRNG